MKCLIDFNQRFGRVPEKGQSLAEYGLVLALVAMVAIGGLQMLGSSLNNQFSGLAGAIQQAGSGGSIAVAATSGASPGVSSQPSPMVATAAPTTAGVARSALAPPSSGPTGSQTASGAFVNGCSGGTCNGVTVNPSFGW